MKKYEMPAGAVISFCEGDLLMASDENETDKDYVENDNLVVDNISDI